MGGALRGAAGVVAVSVLALLPACGDGGRQQVRAVGGIALLEPATLDFGDVALGREIRKSVTITNVGPVELNVAALQPAPGAALGAGADYEVRGLPATIASGGAVALEVRYHPHATGLTTRAVALKTDAPESNDLSMDLRGRAVLGLAQLSGDVLDFGDVVLGEDCWLTFTLTNNDGRAQTEVQVSPVLGMNPEAFRTTVAGDFVMQPEQQLEVRVQFTPQRLGDQAALVNLVPCPTCHVRPVLLRGSGVTRLVDLHPASMDFGLVEVGSSVQQRFSLTSLSMRPLRLDSFSLSGDGAYTVALDGGRSAPLTLAPGETLAGTVTFAPTTFRAHAAAATATMSDGAPGLLALSGTGVGPQLDAQPATLYVGATALGTTRSRALTLANLGFDPLGNQALVVTNLALSTNDPSAWAFRAPQASWTVGEPGQSSLVQVDFTPQAAGFSQATLVISSNDPLHPVTRVALSALGRVLAPCTPRIEPGGTVDFGAVALYHPSTQGFELTNDGQEDCIVGDPTIVSGGPSFRWPGGAAPQGRTLPPGGRMSVRIEFNPQSAAQYQGQVEMYLSNANQQHLYVNLRGEGDAGCFVLAPGTLDFGGAATGCSAPDQIAYAHNWCAGPVTVSAISIDRPQFTLPSGIALPAVIQPNGVLQIPVHYTAATPGDDVGALMVTASTRATQYKVGLTAGALPDQAIHDSWSQSTPKVDLLMVIDNSGSMTEEQAALAKNLDHIWNRIALANADFHIAVTTTGMYPYTAGWTQCPGGAAGGEAGRFFPVDGSRPRILTPQTPDVKNVLFANTAVGLCHWDERFLDPVVAALTPPLVNADKAPGTPWPADGNAGFLRDDARLALLVVSDSDDDNDVASPPPVADAVKQIIAAKHGAADLISFAGLVPLTNCPTVEITNAPAPRYLEIQRQFGGHLEDICNLDNFGGLLDNVLGDLLLPLTSFPLSTRPYDPTKIVVRIDGAVATNWTYDATTNRIVFPPGAVPAPGTQITADYYSACP